MVFNIRVFFKFIKIEHSVFDLPFVYMGVILSDNISIKVLILITIAAISARISGMVINRIIDLPMDKKNPRTLHRALVTRKISMRKAKIIVLLSSLTFIVSAFSLNIVAGVLAPIILFLFYLYPTTKKVPVISHFFLGISIGLIVLGGYVGATATLPDTATVYYLVLFVAFWIAGFDIIYQNQDYKFDKRMGIKSIPVLVNGKIYIYTPIFYTIAGVFLLLFATTLLLVISSIFVLLLLFIRTPFIIKWNVNKVFKIFDAPIPFILFMGLVLSTLIHV